MTHDLDVVMYLFSRGASLTVRDNKGVTALHWAAVNGHLACCRFLVENGVDINALVHDADVSRQDGDGFNTPSETLLWTTPI